MPEFRPGPISWLLLVVLLAGCGQKGPLYLSKPQAQAPTAEQAPAPRP